MTQRYNLNEVKGKLSFKAYAYPSPDGVLTMMASNASFT